MLSFVNDNVPCIQICFIFKTFLYKFIIKALRQLFFLQDEEVGLMKKRKLVNVICSKRSLSLDTGTDNDVGSIYIFVVYENWIQYLCYY